MKMLLRRPRRENNVKRGLKELDLTAWTGVIVFRTGTNGAPMKKGTDVRVEQNSWNFFAQTLPCHEKPLPYAVISYLVGNTLHLHYKG
jgi:hypothetical protein